MIIIEEEPFKGWAITKGQIWTPENVGFLPGEIRAIQYRAALISELQKQLRDHWRKNPVYQGEGEFGEFPEFRKLQQQLSIK